jgi:hypothetical protein
MRRMTLGVLLAALVLALPATAQETRGTIEGVIKDSEGGVLPGATVVAKSASGMLTTVTDGRGIYRFPALEPGVYEVVASMDGFASARNPPVTLAVGVLLKVDLKLVVGGVAETVNVVAEATTIDVKQTTAATNLAAEAIDRLPKGRDFQSVVTLAPGANQESRSGGMSVDGASAAENKFYLDGVDTTNLRTGVSATPFLTDFIQEVQVKSSGYAAEFGGATGGVISVISKSGSNAFHGEAGAYFTSNALNGDLSLNSTDLLTKQNMTNARQVLRLKLSGENEAEQWLYPKDTYSRWDPHVQFGGPLVRNTAWFWVGYTPQFENTERTLTFVGTGQTGTFASKETTQNLVGNVTWQLTQALHARVSGQSQPYTQKGRLPAIDGTGSPENDYAALGLEQRNVAGTASLDWVASNRLFFTTRLNYLNYDTRDVGIPKDIWYNFNGSNLTYETRPDMVRAHGFNSVVTNQARTKDRFWRYGATADASMFFNGAGQHAVKAGVQFERIGNDVMDFEQAPHVYLRWNQTYTSLSGERVRGTYGYWSWREFGTRGLVTVDNVGLFVQDAWAVNSRLTVNLGLRTERETVPSYRPELNGIDFSFADKLAPRAGFAYDVRGDGKWKAYGSWGVFYDVMKLELPRSSFGGDVYVRSYYTLDTLDWNTLMVNGNKPGRFIETIDWRLPSNDPAHPEAGAIDPDLKPFRQQELVFGVEHELSSRVAVSARYVHKQVDRAIEDVGIPMPGLGEVFTIANPGEGMATYIEKENCPTCPAMPKSTRSYDALELKVVRRFGNNWMFNGSYTLSRLYGNYPGLASSDEIARVAPNVTRLFDGLVMAFDETGQPAYGRLNTDRPHQFKVAGAYQLPTRTMVAGVWRAASGIPISRSADIVSTTPVFYQGRMSDGRTPWLTVFDLNVAQDIPLGRNVRGQIAINVLNLLDQKGVTDVWRNTTRQTIPIPLEEFFAGFDAEARIDSLQIMRDPQSLRPSAWQSARDVRINFKLMF